jgi:hypothetical protein
VYDTINQKIHVSPGQISFNDTDNIEEQYITIYNPGDTTEEFTVKSIAGRSLAPFDLKTKSMAPLEPVISTTNPVSAQIDISDDSFVLEPGHKRTIRLKVTGISPTTADQPYPIYGGFIQFVPGKGSSHPGLNVPYIGVKGSLKSLSIFDDHFPRLLTRPEIPVLEEGLGQSATKHFFLDRTHEPTSFVIIGYRLLTGTKELRMEVLDNNKEYIGLADKWNNLARNIKEKPNEYFTSRWNGTMRASDSENLDGLHPLKEGTYYLQWKALRLLSNPEISDNWETIVSEPVHIVS